MEKNLDKYKTVLADVFNVEVEKVNETFSKNNIKEWDSIHQLSLVALLEEKFDIMFDPEDIVDLTSYSKGIEIMKKIGVEF